MQITLQQSQQVKGLAILFMLFLHLFMNENFADGCTPLFYIGDIPLATIITRSCAPVGYFLMMSGYGLAYSYSKGSLGFKRQIKKVCSLYCSYWLVILVFVPIGIFVNPERYPGEVSDVISNITGWNTTYNASMWFLFPYTLLAITSPMIFNLMDKIGNLISFFISLVMYIGSCYIISRYIAPNDLYHEFYVPILTYLDLLLSFLIGALFFKTRFVRGAQYLRKHPIVTITLLLILFCSHFVTSFQGMNPFFEAAIIYLFIQMPIGRRISQALESLGKHSMFMWMTHTYFALYLFHDFIYGFKYPIVIYFVLIIISYLTSLLFERIVRLWQKDYKT